MIFIHFITEPSSALYWSTSQWFALYRSMNLSLSTDHWIALGRSIVRSPPIHRSLFTDQSRQTNWFVVGIKSITSSLKGSKKDWFVNPSNDENFRIHGWFFNQRVFFQKGKKDWHMMKKTEKESKNHLLIWSFFWKLSDASSAKHLAFLREVRLLRRHRMTAS